MIYDGDCGFCGRWIARWRRLTGNRVAYEPYQTAAARFPGIPLDDFRHAVHLVTPDGRVFRGAEAVFASLGAWPLAVYRRVPGLARLAERAYRYVADHRNPSCRLPG